MLSTSIVKNVSEAGHYYAATDNYYTMEEGVQQSEWFGRSSVSMNLSGKVDPTIFTALLKGEVPNGEIIGKKIDDKIVHRAGWDLTFSAPKSVSIMALLGDDKRLIEAHRQAVHSTLSEIERGCSEVRIKTNSQMTYSHTKNMVAALFHHDLSRAEDPQLHTHSVIMNLTQRHDGNWRSMASKIGRYDKNTQGEVHGFIERVRNNKRYFGKLYETELAYQVKQLGYEIRIDEKTGVFEIKDVPQNIIEYFSKRRNKIQAFMEKEGLTGQKAAEYATLNKRDKKIRSDRTVLLEKWIAGGKDLDFDATAIIHIAHANTFGYKDHSIDTLTHESVNILSNVINSLIQFKTTFSIEELIAESTEVAIQKNCEIKRLFEAVDKLIENGSLLALESAHGKPMLLSKTVIDDENIIKQILASNSQIKGNVQIEKILNKENYSSSEMAAIHVAFNSDQYVLVEGCTAKDLISNVAVKLAKQERLDIAIVSPNQIASKHLSLSLNQAADSLWNKFKSLFSDTSIPHFSTSQFLNSNTIKTPDILLVDNTHLLSTSEQASLLKWGQESKSKLLFFTEKDLLVSQKRGIDFNFLIKHGVRSVTLHENQVSLKSDFKQIDIKAIFDKVQNHIIEVPDQDERLIEMAKQFSRMKDSECAYLVGNNKVQASQLNLLAHDQLKSAGKIHKSLMVDVLNPHYLPDHKRNLASSYPTGEVIKIRLNDSKKSQSEYLTIVGKDTKDNTLLLKGTNKKTFYWKPDDKAELFKQERREWSVGDRLLSHRGMKYVGVVKGEMFTISGFRGTKVKLSREQGKSIFIDVSKRYHRHFDYGYARTSHQLAHVKAKHFIADCNSRAFDTNRRQFNQLVIQPENISIYTDDSNRLIDTLQKKTGNKLSGHDIRQTSIDVKEHLRNFYRILERAIVQIGDTENKTFHKAADAIDYAIKHLTERNAGFTHKELMEVALKTAIGNVNKTQLLEVVGAMEKSGIILRGMGNDGVLWTTQEAIKLENEIIQLTRKDQGVLSPIAKEETIRMYFKDSSLNSEQIDAIKNIVKSTDRILTIQGRAGTGKTTMMASLADVLASKTLFQDLGYQILGIAPTHKAVKELTARGIQSRTIDRFLLDMKNTSQETALQSEKTILIMDESSMVSNRKMRDVLVIAHEFNFRQLIATGDIKQLSAVEAGKPYQLIQQILDHKVITLEDIRRQKNPVLKNAVQAIYQGDVSKTFSILSDSIREINHELNNTNHKLEITLKTKLESEVNDISYQKRIQEISKEYVQRLEMKDDVQIIAPSHTDRKAINDQVREQLNEKGHLHGPSYLFPVLIAKDMTAIERSEAQNFKVGQIIRFATSKSAILPAGEYFVINAIDQKLNILSFNKLDGKSDTIHWRIPATTSRTNNDVEVFHRESRQLKTGDKIFWVRTDKKENIHSSQGGMVLDIKDDNITVRRTDGSEIVFNGKQAKHQHWDHGYAITAYGAQGGTYSTVLALFESYRKNLMNLKTFLVTITRPVNNLVIYTDDKVKLQEQFKANLGDKVSSLEVINKYPAKENPSSLKASGSKTLPDANRGKVKFTYDIQRIKESLNQNAEQIAIEILGQPKVRGSNFLKFGSHHGSLSVTIKGEKAGWWNDFSDSNSKGRSMLSFIEKHFKMSKPESIEYAARWLGIAPNSESFITKSLNTSSKKQETIQGKGESDYQKKMRVFAEKIAKESLPLSGTLAEKYLKKFRGIDSETMKISEDIRFHTGIYSAINKQKIPALVSIVRNIEGLILAVETVFLDPKTGNKAADVTVGKQTFGLKKGGFVTVNSDTEKDTVILAEGTVTALSIVKALPDIAVKSVLGKQLFLAVELTRLPKNIVFCPDYDGKELRMDQTLRQAADRLQMNNKNVRFMIPTGLNLAKYDFNNVLNSRGEEAIRESFKQSISYENFYKHALQDLILKKGLEHLKQQCDQESHKNMNGDKLITQNDISQFSRNLSRETLAKDQKMNRLIEKTNENKSIKNTPEKSHQPIHFEKEI